VTAALNWLDQAPASARQRIANSLNDQERAEFDFHWTMNAREAQLAPPARGASG